MQAEPEKVSSGGDKRDGQSAPRIGPGDENKGVRRQERALQRQAAALLRKVEMPDAAGEENEKVEQRSPARRSVYSAVDRSGSPGDQHDVSGQTQDELAALGAGSASPTLERRDPESGQRAGGHTDFDDERAGNSLEQYLPRLRAFAAHVLRAAGLDVDGNLEDIVHTAVAALLAGGPAVDDRTPWRSYLCGELRNAVRQLRQHVRRFCRTDEPPEHFQCSPLSQVLRRSELAAALGGLPVERREPLLLRFFDGYDVAEIAVRLGIPVRTAKWRLHAGLRNAAALRAVRHYFET